LKSDAGPVALPVFSLTMSCDAGLKKNAPLQMLFRQ